MRTLVVQSFCFASFDSCCWRMATDKAMVVVGVVVVMLCAYSCLLVVTCGDDGAFERKARARVEKRECVCVCVCVCVCLMTMTGGGVVCVCAWKQPWLW